MITANQASKLEVATHLKAARDELAKCMSSIQWQNREREEVSEIMTRIEKLFEKVIPNTKEKHHETHSNKLYPT